jgi:hypothetical protein
LLSEMNYFQGVYVKTGHCQQFPTIFGVVLAPPPLSHSEHQKKFGEGGQNFSKMYPNAHNEPWIQGSKPRFRGSFCAGISRVKLLKAKSATWSNCESPPCNISAISLIFLFLSESFNWPLQPVHGTQLNFQHGWFPAHVDESGFFNPTSLE